MTHANAQPRRVAADGEATVIPFPTRWYPPDRAAAGQCADCPPGCTEHSDYLDDNFHWTAETSVPVGGGAHRDGGEHTARVRLLLRTNADGSQCHAPLVETWTPENMGCINGSLLTAQEAIAYGQLLIEMGREATRRTIVQPPADGTCTECTAWLELYGELPNG